MPAFTSIALATLAVGSLASSVYQGQQGAKQQKRALKAQQQAQEQAEAQAISEQRRAEMETNKANRKTPDIEAILGGERTAGPGATMLTGPTGVDPNQLVLGKLGKKTLLGG